MSGDPVRNSVEDARLYALQEITKMWREAQRLAQDPKMLAKNRMFFQQLEREFHSQMVELGHKHD